MKSFTGRNYKNRSTDYFRPRRAAPHNEIEVVITPDDVHHLTDRRGNPYARVRGALTYRKTDRIRTVMVQGEAYDVMCDLLKIGTSIKVNGHRDNVIDSKTRKVGGEFFRAKDVIKVYDAEGREIDGATGRVLTGHERCGHYRRQRYGPGNMLVKIVWINQVAVNGGAKDILKAA